MAFSAVSCLEIAARSVAGALKAARRAEIDEAFNGLLAELDVRVVQKPLNRT